MLTLHIVTLDCRSYSWIFGLFEWLKKKKSAQKSFLVVFCRLKSNEGICHFTRWDLGGDLPWIRSGGHRVMNGQRNRKDFDFMELPSKGWGSSERPRERATEHRLGLPECKTETVLKEAYFCGQFRSCFFLWYVIFPLMFYLILSRYSDRHFTLLH